MLSVDAERGQILKRHVRAAAALRDLFDDKGIADAVGVNRNAVAAWWAGARMQGDTIYRVSEVTGLSADEIASFIYDDGPPPRLPVPSGPAGLQEGARRADERLADEGRGTRARSPERPPRDVATGRG